MLLFKSFFYDKVIYFYISQTFVINKMAIILV